MVRRESTDGREKGDRWDGFAGFVICNAFRHTLQNLS